LRLRKRGLYVYFQPSSTGVHLDRETKPIEQPAPAGFLRKWGALLQEQPHRPDVLDSGVLRSLAAAPA
jgi:hypothetical protein